MRDDYVPNEKYRNMFGLERNGYGCERVDLYLAQLEVAFKKIREDNRSLKREMSDPAARPPGGLMGPEPPPQDQIYITQLQEQLAQEQEQARHLHAQLAEEQERSRRLMAQLNELQARAAQVPPGQPEPSPAVEGLIAQINALRGEANQLRQQLRSQPPPMYQPQMPVHTPPPALSDETTHSLIGKVLVEARQQAEETLRIAQQEADQLSRKTRQRTEELRAEYDRIYTQLQGIQYAIRNALKENNDYKAERND